MSKLNLIEAQLKVLANNRRLGMLLYLRRNKSATVQELADAVGITICGASQHLRSLRSAGIIEFRKRGLYVINRISLKKNEILREVLRAI